MGGNITLSTNKIREYTAYYDIYDNDMDWNYLGQKQEEFRNTDILMSPSIVGAADLTFRPFASKNNSLQSAYLRIGGKYVGKQYYDNTASDDRSIPAYFTGNLSLGYELPVKESSLSLSLHVNNLFNHMYYADAWLWRAYFQESDSYYNQIGLYPQAPVNFMFKVGWRF